LKTSRSISDPKAVVAAYGTHPVAEAAVKKVQRSGFDTKKLSVVEKDYHTEEQVTGPYNAGAGDLNELLKSLAVSQADIFACRPYHQEKGAIVLFVAEDNAKTQQALDEAGFEHNAEPIVLVASQYGLGFAAQIGMYLEAAGIRLLCSYASPASSDMGYIVLKTTDDEAALRLLKDCPWGTSIMQTCSTRPRKLLAARSSGPDGQGCVTIAVDNQRTTAKTDARTYARSRGPSRRGVRQASQVDFTQFDMPCL